MDYRHGKAEQYKTHDINDDEAYCFFCEKIPVDEPHIVQVKQYHTSGRQGNGVQIIYRHSSQVSEYRKHGDKAAPYQAMQQYAAKIGGVPDFSTAIHTLKVGN
jgi:hypothetical protein